MPVPQASGGIWWSMATWLLMDYAPLKKQPVVPHGGSYGQLKLS